MAAVSSLRLAAGLGGLLSALVLASCWGQEGPSTSAPPPTPPRKERAGQAAEDQPAAARAPRHLMAEHLAAATKARDAVIRGDHDAAMGPLAWLAAHEPPAEELPRGWERYLAAVQAHARAGESAQTLPDAAEAVAKIGRECGACHASMGAAPAFSSEPVPGGSGFSDHMARHQWAADRMWEGLIQPDGDRWRSGAMTFLEDPLHQLDAPGSAPAPAAVARLGQRLHDLGEAGLGTVEEAEQVALYGEVLTACGTCHGATGGGPE